MDAAARAVEQVKGLFPDQVISAETSAGQPFVSLKRDRIHDVLLYLRDDEELSFDCLMDLCGVDYLNQGAPERFAVVYHLFSYKNNVLFRLKAFVPEDDPTIDSVHDLWKSAPWGEREAFDMYGITFKGNPDLRRILLPEYYTGYPLRKDYPLIGMGERNAFPQYTADDSTP